MVASGELIRVHLQAWGRARLALRVAPGSAGGRAERPRAAAQLSVGSAFMICHTLCMQPIDWQNASPAAWATEHPPNQPEDAEIEQEGLAAGEQQEDEEARVPQLRGHAGAGGKGGWQAGILNCIAGSSASAAGTARGPAYARPSTAGHCWVHRSMRGG